MNGLESSEVDLQAYIHTKVLEERELLKHANEYREGEQYYGIRRDEVVKFAQPEIEARIQRLNRPLKVLEIGGGEGRTILRLMQNLPPNTPVEYSMTNLVLMIGHANLLKKGVRLFAPIIAENLPISWSQSFDVVITQCMLARTKMEQSIAEIKRVLVPGGVWVGFEGHNATISIDSYVLVNDVINYWMAQNDMHNQMGIIEILTYAKRDEMYPIKWTKSISR